MGMRVNFLDPIILCQISVADQGFSCRAGRTVVPEGRPEGTAEAKNFLGSAGPGPIMGRGNTRSAMKRHRSHFLVVPATLILTATAPADPARMVGRPATRKPRPPEPSLIR